jgi:hypothetical protein
MPATFRRSPDRLDGKPPNSFAPPFIWENRDTSLCCSQKPFEMRENAWIMVIKGAASTPQQECPYNQGIFDDEQSIFSERKARRESGDFDSVFPMAFFLLSDGVPFRYPRKRK